MMANVPSLTGESIQVAVNNLQTKLTVDTIWLRQIAQNVLQLEGVTRGEITILIVDDAAIRVINAHHLDHDWPTDVISFFLGEDDRSDFCGELVISAETAVREATLREIYPSVELALYVVHGLLHFCGFDDSDEVSVRAMRQRETELLDALGIMPPFFREQMLAPSAD